MSARGVVAWVLLVPVGTALILAGLVVALPGMALGWAGVWCWTRADRLLRGRLIPPSDEVGDDTVAMLRADQDELWRGWMTHPHVREDAARTVRGHVKGDG